MGASGNEMTVLEVGRELGRVSPGERTPADRCARRRDLAQTRVVEDDDLVRVLRHDDGEVLGGVEGEALLPDLVTAAGARVVLVELEVLAARADDVLEDVAAVAQVRS